VINVENMVAYTFPPTITSLAGLVIALINRKTNKSNERKLHSIDHAVNGVAVGEPTLREETQAINQTINGAEA
jgi:hypothetical protein